jgi:putative nucleotidyltransferase with HDIG domain
MKSTFRHFGLMEKLLWKHSTLAGPVTAALAKQSELDADPDEAFTAGLLHDIGKNALANSHREAYEKVVARVYNEKLGFVEAERDEFGFDHAELGAHVAERWKLPSRLVTAIRNHHAPEEMVGLPPEEAELTALVAVSTACLTRNGVGRREPAEGLNLADLPAWRFLRFEETDVESTLAFCSEQVERAHALVD